MNFQDFFRIFKNTSMFRITFYRRERDLIILYNFNSFIDKSKFDALTERLLNINYERRP